MNNLKDVITTICGFILLFCGSTGVIWTLGVVLPNWVKVVATLLATVAGALIAYFQGKNPNGTTKTAVQVDKLNAEAAATKV
jgi:hypothetical protein